MSLFYRSELSYTMDMGAHDIIKVGSQVELNLLDRTGKKDRLSFDIVPDEAADFSQGFLGESTPMARIILGEREGIIIPYLKDDIFAIEVLSVTQSTRTPLTDVQDKRQSNMKKAIRDIEHTNAVIFASSFSGKWGDYDPDSIPSDEIPDENKPESDIP
jgi:hypothetical protein